MQVYYQFSNVFLKLITQVLRYRRCFLSRHLPRCITLFLRSLISRDGCNSQSIGCKFSKEKKFSYQIILEPFSCQDPDSEVAQVCALVSLNAFLTFIKQILFMLLCAFSLCKYEAFFQYIDTFGSPSKLLEEKMMCNSYTCLLEVKVVSSSVSSTSFSTNNFSMVTFQYENNSVVIVLILNHGIHLQNNSKSRFVKLANRISQPRIVGLI